MLFEHRGKRPEVDPSAWVAPTAVLCGDVRVAAGARVLWNAVLSAEDGRVELGERALAAKSTSHGPWKFETRYCGTANDRPATRSAGQTSRTPRQPSYAQIS